jgi:hypothetical protein
MHTPAQLIGAAATLVALGILTLASVRSISRRKDVPPGACPAFGAPAPHTAPAPPPTPQL